ncbi:MAG: SIR2 family protein [Nitrosopumilus sp.]|nr:SIR2 family protein [Nitrosopumilus sp.]
MKIAFLFGAGTSAPSGIPMTKQMISDIIKKPIDWPQKEYQNCGDVIQKILGSTEYNNIEILMEELEKVIDTPREWLEKHGYCKEDIITIEDNQEEAKLLLKEIKNYISNVCHVRTNLDDGKEALRPIIELGKNHIVKIFTTNYDNNIEDTCKDLDVEYSTGIGVDENNKEYFSPVFFNDDKKLGIYKLHGSVYWYRNKNAPGTIIDLDAPDLTGKTIEDAMIYPGRKKELLNYPYSVLFRLFDHAMDKLDKLVVIGHRFEDTHIMEMIEHRIGKNNFELIIVNPKPNESDKIIELSKKPGVKIIPKTIQEWTEDESFKNVSEEMEPIPDEEIIPDKEPIPKREKILMGALVASVALVIIFAPLSYVYNEQNDLLTVIHANEIAKNEYDTVKKVIKGDISKSFEISVNLKNNAIEEYNQHFLPKGVSTEDYLNNTLSKKYENISIFQEQTDTVIHVDPIHYGILAMQNDDGGCKYILYPYEQRMLDNGGSGIPPQEWCPRIESKAGPIMTDVLHSYGGEDFAVDVGMRFDLDGDDDPDGYHLMGMTRGKMCNEVRDYNMQHQFVLVSDNMEIIFDTGKDKKCNKIDAYKNGIFDGEKFGDISPGLFDRSDYPTLSNVEEKIQLSDFKAIHDYDIQENKDVSWTLYMYK